MDDETRRRLSELLERSARLHLRSQALHRRLLEACARAEEVVAMSRHLAARRADRDRPGPNRRAPPR